MKLKLRDYQAEAHGAVIDAIEWGYSSLLVTAATGTGKTVLFSELIRHFLKEFNWKVLVLAPRRELIQQAYLKIRDMCDLKEEYNEIDKEMGTLRIEGSPKVVVGCINTCYKRERLSGFNPHVIICDEAHFCMSDMWKELFSRFPEAVKIGLTATAMRGDRLPVFHENTDGSKTRLNVKGKPDRDTTPEECGFVRHVYDYPLEDAINDGWLIEPRVFVVESGLDISAVKSVKGTSTDGDFSQKELNAVLTKDQKVIVDRINKAIGRWKQVASDRPTVVFCPSVEYGHWAAKLWQDAGYTAAAIDCETETVEREMHLKRVHNREVQITCNYGIYTHGTDVPEWSCCVMLRPTESQGLVCQCIGRVTRPDDSIARILGTLTTAEERLQLIAASPKPDSIVIDVLDIVGKHSLATVPTMLGLPAALDLQGHKLTEAAALVKEFEAAKKMTTFDCPATYEELEASLREIRILSGSGAKSRGKWLVSKDGTYTHGHTPPGYVAKLEKEEGDGEVWRCLLVSSDTGEVVYQKAVRRKTGSLSAYFDSAASVVEQKVQEHQKANPKSTGMYQKVKNAQIAAERVGKRDPRLFYLLQANFTPQQIDTLYEKQVQAIVKKQRDLYWEKKNGKAGTQGVSA